MRTYLFPLVAVILFGSFSVLSVRPGSAASGVEAAASDPLAATWSLPLTSGDPAARGALPTPSASVEAKSEERVDAALGVLSKHVARQSHPDALRYAVRAYYAYKAEHPEKVRKPYLYFVDYGLDNRTPRGYVFDMEALRLVDGPFTVAHGRGSSKARDGVPARFTNTPGSATSSLGLYLAQETYAFSGKSAGRYYRSIGLRLEGLSGRFNSAARSRGVVAHGAPYVTASNAGRSEGCPAMEERRAQRLIPMLANGGLVFLFSPRDERWMREDRWSAVARTASAAE